MNIVLLKSKSLALITSLLLITFISPMVSAATVTWYLQGIVFDDGGTATGSFDFDADTDVITNWNITATDATSPALPTPFTYFDSGTQLALVQDSSGDIDDQSFLFNAGLSFGGTRQFRIDPITLLTNTGGTVALDLNNPSFNLECNNCGSPRLIVAGEVTTSPTVVPLPPALFLMGSALGLFGFRKRV